MQKKTQEQIHKKDCTGFAAAKPAQSKQKETTYFSDEKDEMHPVLPRNVASRCSLHLF